ncbi:MAG TPA: bifunctional diguanylate cyclase/phosphodiesterase [Candidatus Dormibacteraeota bacterium]|nr:bifunctional diguanylate cyclase/phosphodiesterase [Candidatus Dormibacteraeota bacterium]
MRRSPAFTAGRLPPTTPTVVLHVTTTGDPQGERHGQAAGAMAWLHALVGAGPEVAAATSFDGALRVLVDVVVGVGGIDAAAALEPTAPGGEARLIHAAGQLGLLRSGDGLAGLALGGGRTVSGGRRAGAPAEAVVPLLDGGETVALLHLAAGARGGLGVAALRAVEGLGLHAVAVSRLARSEEALLRDPVTGLASKAAWSQVLPRLLATARREGVPLSVAVLDLDHFHAVNEVQGRERGDLLLRQVAVAWSAAVREGDHLCRLGGDSIAVALVGCDLDTALIRAERLCAATPWGHSCSGGVACWDGAEDAVALTDRARTALVDAKVNGRSRVTAATGAGFDQEAAGWTRWAALLPDILDGRRLRSVYQPVVGLVTGRIAAYEALARPAGGPADMDVEGLFAAAQYRGLLRDLDWLCRRAAVNGARSLDPRLPLFVNVSVSALLDPLLDVEHMLLLLRWAERSPENTVLEITEREAVRDLDRFAAVLASYREHGFRFAIDDVGEGHSTLQVLATAVPEFVKVARSLVAAGRDSGREAALRAVVAFAASTGAVVIAEGIETDEEVRRVRDAGIALGQGIRLGPPVDLPSA